MWEQSRPDGALLPRAAISFVSKLMLYLKSRRGFFDKVQFYRVEDVSVNRLSKNECGYTRLKSSIFEEVSACFKLQQDYMLSSNSIYRTDELVVISHPPDNQTADKCIKYLYDKLASSKDGFIRSEERFRYFLNMNAVSSEGEIVVLLLYRQSRLYGISLTKMLSCQADRLLELVGKYGSTGTTKHNRIIVSIGAGRAETEMNSNDLCVCLDKDRKSLYACAFACKYLTKRATRTIFQQNDTKRGIIELLTNI